MPSTYSDGKYWINGLLVKPRFRLPSANTYLVNMKRLILENQSVAFGFIAVDEGITLTDFVSESIHLGINKDLNAQALYLSIKVVTNVQSSNYLEQEIELKIIATTGPQDTFDDAYQLSLCYLRGIAYILDSMDYRELVFGWRTTNFQPHIKLGDGSENPQVTVLTAELGAIPELILKFRVHSSRNL